MESYKDKQLVFDSFLYNISFSGIPAQAEAEIEQKQNSHFYLQGQFICSVYGCHFFEQIRFPKLYNITNNKRQ